MYMAVVLLHFYGVVYAQSLLHSHSLSPSLNTPHTHTQYDCPPPHIPDEFKEQLSLACQFDPSPPSIVLYTAVQDGQNERQRWVE